MSDKVRVMSDKIRVMFLGGSKDHEIREVDRADHDPSVPEPDLIMNPLPAWSKTTRQALTEPEPDRPDREFYRRHRAVTDLWVWWFYVLEGYDPPRRDVIDANPGPFYKS